ncbi:MAG: DUF1559 domain-containing protein [Pirellulaceae bacterium]
MSNSETANAENGKKGRFWNRNLLYSIGILLFLIIGGGLIVPSLGTSPHYSLHMQSMSNLRLIGIALFNYSTSRPDGKFPPAYVADDEGRPKHSWRVLILRELEHGELYEAYDFDKPWDHPDNLKVAEQMPSVYASPFNREQRKLGLTPYQAVSAPGTFLGTTRAVTLRELARSNSQRIMIVADFDDPVPWTKPEDISPAEIISRLQQFRRHSPSQFHVLRSDGSVNAINHEMTAEELGKSF